MIDEYGQVEDPEPQDESMSGMVREQSMMPTGFEYASKPQQNVAMGFSPWAHIGKNSQTQAYNSAIRQQGQMASRQKAPDPRVKDAQFYAGLGDYGAVESLMKTKGASIFQRDEEFEVDDVDSQGNTVKRKFLVGPKGSYAMKSPDGKQINIPAHMLARKAGIGSVPFKGGDEAARNFRITLSKVQSFHRNLAELEALYRNNTYLGSLDPSEDAARARMLESSIKTDYLAIMKDMKGMGGSVSDNDMALAGYMVPQRASSAITRLGGNELAILRAVRESAMRKVLEVGASNGLDFVDSSQSKRTNSYFQKGVIDTQTR